MNTRQYVETLEQCIIDCIAEYGLIGTRISEASGVWLDADGENPRKICAVGLKISRRISMHGFAFNINTDLSFFDNIVPCGLEDKAVTSLSKELGKEMDFYAVQEKILSTFTKYFQ